MNFALCAAVAYLVLAAQANAGWVYQSNDDAFSDEVTHLALGLTSPYGVGFRCTDGDDLALIYMTPEKADDETIDTMALLSPELLVRVDSGEVRKVPVVLELSQSGDIVGISNDASIVDIAKDAVAAKRRLAMAIEVMGQKMHNREMDVVGSTDAISSLIEACSIK